MICSGPRQDYSIEIDVTFGFLSSMPFIKAQVTQLDAENKGIGHNQIQMSKMLNFSLIHQMRPWCETMDPFVPFERN